MRLRVLGTALALSCLLAAGATAASLRVAPINLDVKTGTTSTTLRVWNTEKTPVRIQVRVFRSTHTGSKDTLTPTTDVVASPPLGLLKPGGENLIRIVRVATTPVGPHETYRVLVDQLPDPAAHKAGVVNVLVRHAIPLRFEQ